MAEQLQRLRDERLQLEDALVEKEAGTCYGNQSATIWQPLQQASIEKLRGEVEQAG